MTGRLLTRLFALFGMTLTCVACYGVMYTEFNPEFGAAGRVIDEEGTPIEGIRVHGSSAETATDADGRFYVRAREPFVILTDVDGEANGGEFEEKAISFNSTGTNIDLGDIELTRK